MLVTWRYRSQLGDAEEIRTGMDNLITPLLLCFLVCVCVCVRLLTLYNVQLRYVSPPNLAMPKEVMEHIMQKGIPQVNRDLNNLEEGSATTIN